MSKKISRRSFMKGVGAVAIATAATGVLAGCSNKPDDVVEVVEKKEVRVVFTLENGEGVGAYQTVKVAKDATSVGISEIDPSIVPEGYSIVSTGSVEIQPAVAGYETIFVVVKKDPTTKQIGVTFFDAETGKYLEQTPSITVPIDATEVDPSDIVPPDGYTIVGNQLCFISNGGIIVNVAKKPETKKITVNYKAKLLWSWSTIHSEEIEVLKDATTVSIDQIKTTVKSDFAGLEYTVSDSKTVFTIVNNAIEVQVKLK